MPPARDKYGPVSSGVAGLDEILHGGYPRGVIHLIQGPSGSGKTTLGLHFLVEGARTGEKGLHISTSEIESEIRALADSHAWSLEGVDLHHHNGEFGHAEAGAGQTMLHPSEVELPRTMKTILGFVEQADPDRIVIDSLSEIRSLARNPGWFRRQLLLLKNALAERDCTVLLTDVYAEHDDEMLKSVVTGAVELGIESASYGPDRRALRIGKLRGKPFASGYHDFKIRTGGVEVFPRVAAAEHRGDHTPGRAATGVAALDKMLDGGLDRGACTLLVGTAGVGKSLIATCCVAAAAERGEPALYLLFEERAETFLKRADVVGLPMRRHVEEGTVHLRHVDYHELSPGELTHAVRRAIEEDGIRTLVIDSLNGYRFAMAEDRYLSVHVHELVGFLGQQGVTTIAVLAQHGMPGVRTETPFDISYVADTIVLCRHFEHEGAIRKAISVHKRRAGPHESTLRELSIGADGLALGEPLHEFRGVLTGVPEYRGGAPHDRGPIQPN